MNFSLHNELKCTKRTVILGSELKKCRGFMENILFIFYIVSYTINLY